MADKQIKSTLSIDAKLKGLEKIGSLDKSLRNLANTLKSLKGLKELETLSKGLEKSSKQAAILSKNLAQAVGYMNQLNGAGSGTGGGGGGSGMGRPISDLGGGSGGTVPPPGTPSAGPLTAPQRARQAARHSFGQGFMGAFGVPLTRGPGMWQQYAGQSAGHIVAGLGGSLFNGAAGIGQALSGIPIFGPGLAGQFNATMSAADSALELRKRTQGLFDMGRSFRREEMTPGVNARQVRTDAEMDLYLGADRSLRTGELLGPRRFRDKAEAMGIAMPEAIDMAIRAQRAAGGTALSELSSTMRSGMLYGQRLGIRPEMFGQFASGARTNSFVGYSDRSQSDRLNLAMTQTIADGFKMGLEDADMPKYIEMTAKALEEAKSSGGAISTAAIGSVGTSLFKMGLNPEAALGLTGSLTAAGRRIGAQGPQGADWSLIASRALFGDLPGGQLTPEEFERRQMLLESGEAYNGKIPALLAEKIREGGGGAAGRNYAKSFIGQTTGAFLSTRAMRNMGLGRGNDTAEADALSSEFLRSGLAAFAESKTSTQVTRDAAQTNQVTLDAGMRMINPAQDLRQAQNNAVMSMSTFSESLSGLAKVIESMSTKLQRAMSTIDRGGSAKDVFELLRP